jgi:AcrR family transcriptional regulator
MVLSGVWSSDDSRTTTKSGHLFASAQFDTDCMESMLKKPMKQPKNDRRSARSRRLILAAMMDLLFERSYDHITVRDILDRADVGRSTFYTHFFDKEDVLASIAEQELKLLSRQLVERATGQETIIPSLELFAHVGEHHQYFRAMLRGHARETLWDAAQNALSRNIEQALASRYGKEGRSPVVIPVAVASQYLAGALLNLLKWWLEADMPYTPPQMDQIFQQLALPGVWATFNG